MNSRNFRKPVIAISFIACSSSFAQTAAPAPKPIVPAPVPASALKTLLLDKNDLPFKAELRKDVVGPKSGEFRGVEFCDATDAAQAGRLWKPAAGSSSDEATEVVAVCGGPAEAEIIVQSETHRYAAIFADMSGHTPLAGFAESIWYVDNGGHSFDWIRDRTGAWMVEAFNPSAVIKGGCIVFCRANVAVRIDLDREAGFTPADLFALGAKVARRIDLAAKAAKPVPPTTAAPAKRH